MVDQMKEFLLAFEEVFDKDWQYTKEMLGIHDETPEQKQAAAELGLETIDIIAEEGAFLNPLVEDEIENWGNRGNLLAVYRKLKKAIGDSDNHDS